MSQVLDFRTIRRDLDNKVDLTQIATQSSNGLMSINDKKKIDGIAVGANNYVHPSTDGNKHIPANGINNKGKFLMSTDVAGKYVWEEVIQDGVNIYRDITLTADNGTHYLLGVDKIGKLTTEVVSQPTTKYNNNLILTDENGNNWRVKVNNDGKLLTENTSEPSIFKNYIYLQSPLPEGSIYRLGVLSSGNLATVTLYNNIIDDERSSSYTTYSSMKLDDELTLVKGEIDSIKGKIKADGGYVHPSSHPATMIVEDSSHRFVKVGNECTITTSKAKYIFKRVTNSSINVDAWRLYEGSLIDDNGTEYKMWSNSDAEGTIQIVGEEDFVCGYHGDEIFETIDIIVDGNPIDINSNYDKLFNNITIVSTSRVYHCNTSPNARTQAFTRTKMLKFEGDKVTISNRFKCLEDLNINRAALALFQCYKSQDGTTIINKFSNNNDLLMYNVPTTDDGVMPPSSINMTEASFYTNCGTINFKINKGHEDNPKYLGQITNFNSQNRLKIYFDYIKGTARVNTGDILQTEFEFIIS